MNTKIEKLRLIGKLAMMLVHLHELYGNLESETRVQRRRRRWWALSLYKSRKRCNGTELLNELNKEPSTLFNNFCRMSIRDFECLLNGIGHIIIKKDTIMRKAIPVDQRLSIVLRFLASGESFSSLAYTFRVSRYTISKIVTEVCLALNHFLKDYIKLPKTTIEWKQKAAAFSDKWQFPLCLGAIDGKHIHIQAPANSGTQFYNYKGSFSVVLMALVDADYCFTFVDVGGQGRMHDASIFASTKFKELLSTGGLNLPSRQALPGRTKEVPYVFVGDGAFPLEANLLKPYIGHHSRDSKERIFNYRLSRARRISENAFGILSSRFGILKRDIYLEPEKVSIVCMTALYLHNFLRRSPVSRQIYTPPGYADYELDGQLQAGSWRGETNHKTEPISQCISSRPSAEARSIRQEFAEYFVSEVGSIPFQSSYS